MKKKCVDGGKEILFEPIYHRFYSEGIGRIKPFSRRFKIEEKVLAEFLKSCLEKIQWLYVRCGIKEMWKCKKNGELVGKDSREEYLYYLENYLRKPSYQEYFFGKYPVLYLLLKEKLQSYVDYIEEVLLHYMRDWEEIRDILYQGQAMGRIAGIQGGWSDEHISGKTVVRLELENGSGLFYKPHGLTNLASYQKFSRQLHHWCEQTTYEYRYIDKKTYGWELEVSEERCRDGDEVREYYTSMGVQMCLAYVLGISDMHGENVIAHGKYPVFIDLEVFPDRFRLEKGELGSVCQTGMLPASRDGRRVDMGAIRCDKMQQEIYKVPCIIAKGTSDMRIEYRYAKKKWKNGLPILYGERQDYRRYVKELLDGFERAYEQILLHKEMFQENIKRTVKLESRCVIRNTQEYIMYQSMLTFPEMMQEEEKRQVLLRHMEKGLKKGIRSGEQILKYEQEKTAGFCVPLFYAKEQDFYLENQRVVKGYFSSTVSRTLQERTDRLSEKDCQLQKKRILISLLPDIRKEPWLKEKMNVREIAEQLEREMMYQDGKITWMGVRYETREVISPVYVDLYLYQGLAGIAIFFTAAARIYGDKGYRIISQKAMDVLAAHTCRDELPGESPMGLFTGEASLVYSWLILYQISGEEACRIYAKKHCDRLMERFLKVKELDLLAGKAGFILVLWMMYEEFSEKRYKREAVFLADRLLEEGQQVSLAGLAHGISGIALSLAIAWKMVKKQEYRMAAEKMLRYENTLFDLEYGNWMDIRGGKPEDTSAWCHGAPGILLARLWIKKIFPEMEDSLLMSGEAYRKTVETWKESGCLCHGNAGIREILKFAAQTAGVPLPGVVKCEDEWIWMEDAVTPGFMTGLSGIGYSLLREISPDLPNVLGFLQDNI